MRPPMGKSQSEAYRQKTTVRRIIWTIVLLFILYSVYAIGKPLFVMWLFERDTDKICEEKRLSDRNLSFDPIITEIQAAADNLAEYGLSLHPEDGITYRAEGGINHIAIKFTTKGSWCGKELVFDDWESTYMSAQKRTGY